MLSAAVEGYIESLVVETSTALNLTTQQQKDIADQAGRSHGMNVHHAHTLFASVGMPFVLDGISWQGLPSGGVRDLLKSLAKSRNQIAHGRAPAAAQLTPLERSRHLVARLSDRLDQATSDHVKEVTGTKPW
ncbi:hypothetical protein [Ornithinimicrobium murale]|uniref:hypothetical protein n=1 Tax=Ornithinimicrobium murale TaxID=1050153 RepID=UPI000E0D6386|nr:hypothetical protein [Ornithinimicrobium murale]